MNKYPVPSLVMQKVLILSMVLLFWNCLSSPESNWAEGRWYSKSIDTATGYLVTTERNFLFGPDLYAEVSEIQYGQKSTAEMIEWEYHSNGSYKTLGDTIYLEVTAFRRIRDILRRAYVTESNTTWVADSLPPFDSTVTDGSHDRVLLRQMLFTEFVKR